jgi:hypothetical protein
MLETLLVVLTLLQFALSLQVNVYHRLLQPSSLSSPPKFTYKGTIDLDSTIRMSTSQLDNPCVPLTITCHVSSFVHPGLLFAFESSWTRFIQLLKRGSRFFTCPLSSGARTTQCQSGFLAVCLCQRCESSLQRHFNEAEGRIAPSVVEL